MKKNLLTLLFALLFIAGATSTALADGTIDVATKTGTGTGWHISNDSVYIDDFGSYTITGTSTTTQGITVAKGAVNQVYNITLENANITAARPFYMVPNTLGAPTTVNLYLQGVNSLTATQNGNPGLNVAANTKVNFYGPGKLTATGKSDGNDAGPGIGAISANTAGTMNFYGGIINAVGTGKACSIGSGYHGSGGTINVSGGIITATSGYGIGNYNGSAGNLVLSGNGIIFTNTLHGNSRTDTHTAGLLYVGDAEQVWKGTKITPTDDFTFPAGRTLTIPEGDTLFIAQGNRLINYGTIIVNGALIFEGNGENHGVITINNPTTINSGATFYNEREGVINVYGYLNNYGALYNRGTINGLISGNQPIVQTYSIDVATVSGSGEGYTLSGDVITLTEQDVIYILSGTTTSKRVEVAPNITTKVTFNGLDITSAGNAFSINASSIVRLTLAGANALTSTGGTALQEASGVNLTILGTGSLVATGSTAGIGSATTSIDGGWVTASSIAGTLKLNGNAVVFAGSVSDNSTKTQGVLFKGDDGILYGAEVTPDFDYTIPSGKKLTIDNAKILTVPAGKTVTNNGEIHVYGDLDVQGTIVNNGAIYKYGTITGQANITGNAVQIGVRNTYTIDMSTVSASGTGYTYNNGAITLTENNAEYVVTGTTTNKRIIVPASVSLNVKLQNVSIICSQPFYITPLGVVNLELVGNNTLKSNASGKASLGVPSGAKIIIDGEGSLLTESTKYGSGGDCGAGIGGDTSVNSGYIVINNGTIIAISDAKAAAIGGGYHAGYESIIINGGYITAKVEIFAGTQGDGIGGYPSAGVVPCGEFKVKNATLLASFIRDKKQHENSLIFDDRQGVIYGASAVIDRDVTLPQYGVMTVKKDQTLTINAGTTLTIPHNSELVIEDGATLIVNGNIVGNAQSTYRAKSGATVTGASNISIANIPYDYRDRLYLDFHIIKTITGVTSPGTLSDAGITTTTNTINTFEQFMEGLFPNINVVINIDTLETSGVISGPKNNAIQVNIGSYSIPGAAGTYASNTIQIPVGAGGWSSVGVAVHEYYHHTTQWVTASDPDDGRSFDQLYQDWSDFRANQFVQIITNAVNIGEQWDGDNVWLRNDPKVQTRPANVVFPDYVTITKGGALSTATWTGAVGSGTFAMSNPGYVPSAPGELYAMNFRPTNPNEHLITQYVQVRYAGEKLPLSISVTQPNIANGETPNPVYSIDPAEQYVYNSLVVEYKVQNTPDPYTTTVPTAEGFYSVRVSFAGDENYEAAFATANFTIGNPVSIEIITETGKQLKVATGEGFIKIFNDGDADGQLVRIYTLTGSLYATTYVKGNETVIPAQQGLYIVNCGTTRKKVIVK